MPHSDVLVVDDSPYILQVYSGVLTSKGHGVRTAASGQEALEKAVEQAPDLVLLDVRMPEPDGFEVCRRLRRQPRTEHVPVVFISGVSTDRDRVEALRLGDDFLYKPLSVDELVVHVERHLARARAVAELEARVADLEREQELGRAQHDLRQRLLASVVHDLKSPLTPVLKNTEWLLAEAGLHGEAKEALLDVSVAANHLQQLILTLLDLARGEQHALQPRLEGVVLADWLAKALAVIRLRLRHQPDRLRAIAGQGAGHFDPALMGRVLQNLVDNALRFAPSGTSVEVELRATGAGGVLLTVEDSGPGVALARRPHLFDAWFEPSHAWAPDHQGGHGLGLAFCRQAVVAHRGTLRLEDVQPQGARFVVELPPVPR